MFEWAKDGDRILAESENLDPIERRDMQAKIAEVKLRGEVLERMYLAEAATLSARGMNKEQLAGAFGALYPQYRDSGFSCDLQIALAFDAPEEARRFDHKSIWIEHLLLAVLYEGSPAKPILNSLGVTIERTREAVLGIIGRGERPVIGDLGLSFGATSALAQTVEEAKRLNRTRPNRNDLLLGLVRVEGVNTLLVLKSMGTSSEMVRQAVYSAHKK